MSVNTFIGMLRKELEQQRAAAVDRVTGGTLDEKSYGYACGYIKIIDDMLKTGDHDHPGIIEFVYDQMQKG